MGVRSIELFDVDAIRIADRFRTLDEQAVSRIQESIQKIGLRTPITIRMTDLDGISDAVLVTGQHRLEAARRLGWQQIECFVADNDDELRARMWEIAENLHRAELSVLDRAGHVAEWIRLAGMVSPQLGAKPTGGRPVSGVRLAARELQISKSDADRQVKIAGMSDEAKEAARELGFDGNQSVLERAARAPDNVAFLRSEHDRREAERSRKELEKANRDHDRVVEITEAEHFAHWLMERADLQELSVLIAWLEGTKPREVIDALRRKAA